ncbi:hypothetical protein Kfla_0972 [Kribbella flavida DSM 17836]|uniref:Uncharacterized protein n=1 Tax=Kribbella flavida (strain DSM 17836 / JCM 10339 / NBRC 14399) TaxID=479435 RepID=D2Q189_KRIFD|nr:hypothetical protein [Kribbella flavida]ADB30077.1 hypothetical protein Kfla_0972 [Kribbella flavida DSM 17836]
MAHVAPTSHRRGGGTHASHRGDSSDGPIQTTTWLGLTFALVLGLVLSSRDHVGVHAAGLTLLIMLMPLTIAVFGSAVRRGLGSGGAAFCTAVALTIVVLKFVV